MRVFLLVAILFSLVSGIGLAQTTDTITFTAPVFRTVSDFVNGNAERSVTIESRLQLPSSSSENKHAAAVILHTCSGPGLADRRIGERLRREGFATLNLDSYKQRGWKDGCDGSLPFPYLHQSADALLALKAIAKHSRVDPDRIAVIGASMGGHSTYMAAWSHAAKIYAGDGGLRYAAHVGFFPSSNFGFSGLELTGAPVLFLVGRDDDWTPLETIQRLVRYWKQSAPEISLTVRDYPTGHNWFTEGDQRYRPDVVVSGYCPIQIFLPQQQFGLLGKGGELRDLGPASAFSQDARRQLKEEFDKCVSKGATVMPNAWAAERSLDDMISFLRSTVSQR